MHTKFTCLSFVIFLCLVVFTKNANAQSYIWAKNQVGSDQAYGLGTAADNNGNIYVTGKFFGLSATFGGVTLNNVTNSFSDFYIVKYDPSGNVLWARSAGGTNSESGNAVTTDANGNVYVTGWFVSPTVTFGTITLTNAAQYFFDIFIVKYDPNGNVVWAKSYGGSNDDKANSIACDPKGNIYITGGYKSDSIFIAGHTISNVNFGIEDIFLIKFDAQGNVLRAVSYGTFAPEIGTGIATDANSNVYLSGGFAAGSLMFGSTFVSSVGQYDGYIVKFDSSGAVLWAKGYGGTGIETALGLAPDKKGNVYLSGYFMSPSVTLGSTTLTNKGTNTAEAILIKYDNAGNVLWAKSANGTSAEYAYGTTVDRNGNVFLAGSFNSSLLTIGTTDFPNKGMEDMFLIKYDASGNIISVKINGGTKTDFVQGMTVDNNNNLFVVGSFSSMNVPFGNDTISSAGMYEMFITKISANNTGIPGAADNEPSITIFPNPSNGSFTITLPAAFGTIDIYNLLGERIFSEPVSLENEINLSNISPGIYIIKVSDGEKQFMKEIIVE